MSLKNLYSSNCHQLRECQVKITAVKVALINMQSLSASLHFFTMSLGSLNNEVFERPTSTGSELFAILGSDLKKKKKRFLTGCIYQSKDT